MKKATFFFLMSLTFYLAAMYQSMPLMLLFSSELLLVVWMWMLSCYLKRYITVVLPERSIVEEKREKYWCDCKIVNRGRLPVSRCRLRVQVRYLQESKGVIKHVCFASETGIHQIRFGVRAPYCGMVCLRFDRLQVYDYLALFSGKNALLGEIKLAVLPPRQPLFIEIVSEWDGEGIGQERTSRSDGDAVNEIRQIREYREGDAYRHIHWNQSARTERVWIKEYEKEVSSCVDLLLEIDLAQWKNPKSMDAFYRLLYSIILGLLQRAYRVKIHWYDGHPDQLAQMEIMDEKQCQDMLLKLYLLDFSGLPDTGRKVCDTYLKLDSGLGWYRNDTLVYRFSAEHLEQEITERIFTL